MKENEIKFMNSVVDYYYSTIDSEHSEGNMSAVAEHFKITRAKVNKILITAGVIDSPLHQDIMKFKEEGYDISDIALALGVSTSTVKINIPYEKVIYNGEEKSSGAEYVESFRKREKVFLSKVVRKKTNLGIGTETIFKESEKSERFEEAIRQMGLSNKIRKDDPIHLNPLFTSEEIELFKISPNVIVLHIELDASLKGAKKETEIKYGNTISRDIIVPYNIPLHNLHYAINQAFGFTNSHLHEYTLFDEDLEWITQNKVSRWKDMVGLIFKNPYRDENLDFWDDDYESGSPKKWMRGKYTGPIYRKVYEESYFYIHDQIKDEDIFSKTLDDLKFSFELNPFALNETISVGQIFSTSGHKEYEGIEEYDGYMKKSIEQASVFSRKTEASIPFVYPFVEKLHYTYDFGDNWRFTITCHDNVEYLKKRVSPSGIKEAIKHVLTLARPIVIAADGLPLIEDVGGVYGFIDFLNGEGLYEDKKASLRWAKGNEWPGEIGNLKSIL